MIITKLNDSVKGWFVGQFAPTSFATDAVEVAVKNYKAGLIEPKHHHKIATELTLILSGNVKMNDQHFSAGDIVRIEPGESVQFETLTDVVTVVVKLPCVAGDKYLD